MVLPVAQTETLPLGNFLTMFIEESKAGGRFVGSFGVGVSVLCSKASFRSNRHVETKQDTQFRNPCHTTTQGSHVTDEFLT